MLSSDYPFAETDANGDGIPDELGADWEWSPVVGTNETASGANLTANAFGHLSAGEADAVFSIYTTRTAILDWGDGHAVLERGLHESIRLRFSANNTFEVALYTSPDGAGTGVWKAGMAAAWDPTSGIDSEGNRILTADGGFLDIDDDAATFAGFLSCSQIPETCCTAALGWKRARRPALTSRQIRELDARRRRFRPAGPITPPGASQSESPRIHVCITTQSGKFARPDPTDTEIRE